LNFWVIGHVTYLDKISSNIPIKPADTDRIDSSDLADGEKE